MFEDQTSATEDPLSARFFSNGPKRILSLDGGGIRGILTSGILAAIARTSACPIISI